MTPETARTATAKVADLMTVRDVNQHTGIPENTLRWFRHVGQGPKSFKVGRRIMYRREDVDAWLAESYRATVRGA